MASHTVTTKNLTAGVSPETQADLTAPRPPAERSLRLAGVDSIRLLLALWVYFSHFGLLPIGVWIGKSTPARSVLTGLANNAFNGAAAVIGFFVISGLCIHYPYRRSARIPILEFYTRRYIRISIPLLAALLASRLVGDNLTSFYNSILWSLIAELIYYTLYPMLRHIWLRFGWAATLLVSYSLALVLILLNPGALNFHDFGLYTTWVVGLPAWLLGCYLAETWKLEKTRIPLGIWAWRLIVWCLASAASVLRFHAGIGYPITLTLLGPLLYRWLFMELGHSQREPAIRAFEWAGQFSYSIYLMHGLAVVLLGLLAPTLAAGDKVVAAIVRLGCVLVTSYVFFRLVERPSHSLARWAARQVRGR